MKSSVIVCTRNRFKELIRFSNSLCQQTDLPLEYIIVDSSDSPLLNNSELNIYLKSIKSKLNVKYIHSLPGLTKQRNIGVKKAKGDLLYFFDDDIVLTPNFLKEMNKVFVEHKEYAGGMGLITNRLNMNIKRILEIAVKRLFLLQNDYGDGKFYASGNPNHSTAKEKFLEVEVLSGGLTGYRKNIFKEFLFDETLKNYCYMEDVDFSRRVSYKYALFQNPLAKCKHLHGEGGRGNLFENRQMFIYNNRYLFDKNFKSHGEGNSLAHWWSIIGLFVFALIFSTKNVFTIWKGYFAGLIKYKNNKKMKKLKRGKNFEY